MCRSEFSLRQFKALHALHPRGFWNACCDKESEEGLWILTSHSFAVYLLQVVVPLAILPFVAGITPRFVGVQFNAMITPPRFGINPELGKVVPAVNASDLKALLDYFKKAKSEGHTNVAFGMDVLRMQCSENADVDAVFWRASHLSLALTYAQDEFSAMINNGEPDDRLIELFATFPFRFVEVNGSVYRLNEEEFSEEIRKAGVLTAPRISRQDWL